MDPADLVRAHGGAARWRTIQNAGFTWRQVADFVARGRLVHVGYGTYALPTADPAVVAAIKANGFLCHTSAATIWNLSLLRRSVRPHVLVADNSTIHLPDVQLHRVARRQLVDTVRRPWPTTTLERTLLDCARTLPFPEALVIVDSALGSGRIDRETISKLADSVRGPGSVRARRALAAGDGRADSVGESATRAAALDAGLPPPELQYEIRFGPTEFAAFTDLAWRRYRGREVKLAVEFDGLGPHGTRNALIQDRWRRNKLERAGWGLLEITMGDVMKRYEATGQMIKDTLERRWRDLG
ncbi:MAG TPA: hypothetical protein VKE25_09805 [Actinomycetes bacterium]|nr:hypothetical protein [Actinomycetes bacterium]